MRPMLRQTLASRDTWVDLGLLAALLLVTLLGLAPTYSGTGFLVVAMVGALLGIVVAVLSRTLGWPGVSAVLMALALFYLLGGALCLHGEGAGATYPGPTSVRLLSHEALFGWKDLLTTLPPIDAGGPLLVLPLILGLAGGVLGALLAGVRTGPSWLSAPLPLLSPLALLALVILLGVREPQSLWLQGVAFALLALVWVALRHSRVTPTVRGDGSRTTRLATAGALVVGAGLLALPVGSWAAGADSGRTILRTYVDPPFDIGQYPSPLASFRRYVQEPRKTRSPQNLYHETLFTVSGVPAGTRVRIAT